MTLLPSFLLLHCCAAFALKGPLVSELPVLRVPIVWGTGRTEKEVTFPGSHSRYWPSRARPPALSTSWQKCLFVYKTVQSYRPHRGRRGPDRQADLPSIPVGKAGEAGPAPRPVRAPGLALPSVLLPLPTSSPHTPEPGQAGGKPGICPAILQLCELEHIPCPLCVGGHSAGHSGTKQGSC